MRKNHYAYIAGILFLVIIFILLLTHGFGERALGVVQKPLVSAGTWVYKHMSFFRSQYLTSKEIELLEQKVVDLTIDKGKLEEIERENQVLKQTLGFIERSDLHSVMASIIARSNTTKTATFSVDKGSKDGIREGDPVIVKDGILIGKIVSVTPKTSTVNSLLDPSVATAVSLLNESQTIGVAEGEAGNLLKLKFIPQETKISINDIVISSGLESNIPPGLFIGLVNDVRPELNAPFLEAIIEPLVDVRLFATVHVLIQQGL